jgi:arylsulfatase
MNKAYLFMAAQALVGEFLKTFKEFPPAQKAAAFNLDEVMRKMSENPANG